MVEHSKLQSTIELLKAHVQSQDDAIKTLENKAQQNLGLINIIVAIVAILNLGLDKEDQVQHIIDQRPMFILILGLYVIIAILSIFALRPREHATHPMKPTWCKTQEWLEYEPEKYYDKVIAEYTDIYKHNAKIVIIKGYLVLFSHILIAVDIGLIFMEATGLFH